MPTHIQAANTVLLNDESPSPSPNLTRTRSHGSSAMAESTWAPSQPLEADDDASIRPLPPTSPPSPSPSRSSSSHLSDPRTFRSAAASTKPTTVMSFDSGHGGAGHLVGTMAHIAQAPAASSSSSPSTRFPGAIVHPAVVRAASLSHSSRNGVQAPLHTYHHPRNNPHPSSPPLDNASTLTLASSAYANPGRTSDWADGASLSVSYHFNDMASNSSHLDVDDGEEAEPAASIRALRPRSSRRGSWESIDSRWSARVGGPGTPSVTSGITGVTRAASIGGNSNTGVTRHSSVGKLKLLGVTDEHDGQSTQDTASAASIGTVDRDREIGGNVPPNNGPVPVISVEGSTPQTPPVLR